MQCTLASMIALPLTTPRMYECLPPIDKVLLSGPGEIAERMVFLLLSWLRQIAHAPGSLLALPMRQRVSSRRRRVICIVYHHHIRITPALM